MSATIGELSLVSGVPIATLRDWDRRHGLSPSHRTIGNHRRYTEDDAALVCAVRDLVSQGLRLRAAVLQARDDRARERRLPDPARLQSLADHQRLRSESEAARAQHVARRDELVAAREQLVARRHLLVAQHGETIAGLAADLHQETTVRGSKD